MVGCIYGYYDIHKQHSHRTKLSTVHIDYDSKLMFISVHYVKKCFMGILYMKVPRPLPPQIKFLDETLASMPDVPCLLPKSLK